MLAVVTDSTCDLHPDTARALGLHIVPLQVVLGERTFLDWQDIDPDAVYDHQRTGGTVTTRPASQEAFEATYRQLLATHDAVLSLHLSGQLSATAEHARQAARALNTEDRVRVVDSGLASIALAEAAIAAREAVQAGGDLQTALAAAQATGRDLLVEFTVPTLEYLRRGGRLSRTQELLGNMLGVRPILGFQTGVSRLCAACGPPAPRATFWRGSKSGLAAIRSPSPSATQAVTRAALPNSRPRSTPADSRWCVGACNCLAR